VKKKYLWKKFRKFQIIFGFYFFFRFDSIF
jgi:hypothetical protein